MGPCLATPCPTSPSLHRPRHGAPQPSVRMAGRRKPPCHRLWPLPRLAPPSRALPRPVLPSPAATALIESSREGCPSVLPCNPCRARPGPAAAHPRQSMPLPRRALPCQTGAYTSRMPSASTYLRFKSAVLGPPVANAHKFAGIRCDLFNVPQV